MDEFHARRLVDLYADTILRISYSYLKQTCDAEDICQTVFLKYLTNDCTFDSIDHEKAWIIRTTINACKDYLKSAHFRRTVALDEAEAVAAPPVPDTEVLDALKRLPEQYRISLYLFYYEEYSAREIAQVMGKSEANITQYLSRGPPKPRVSAGAGRSSCCWLWRPRWWWARLPARRCSPAGREAPRRPTIRPSRSRSRPRKAACP